MTAASELAVKSETEVEVSNAQMNIEADEREVRS
jgi:hypothetical protein